ncbi:MAG: hypothetical protein ABI286_09650 [Edaphobacter sp.]
MSQRSIFIHGLSLTLRRFPAFLWTYLFNLALAVLFSIGLHLQLTKLLNHSLAAQRLSSGFDLGTMGEALLHLHQGPAGDAGAELNHASIPLYLLIYFLLIPGTLFCYQTGTPARLSTLLQQGVLYFWRFVRITILTLIVSALILGPLFFLQGEWADYIDKHIVGRQAFFTILTGYIILFLVASVLRLYFDLVEVYTVQLGLRLRSNDKPDRRVLRTVAPAWRTLWANFSQAWPVFLFLTIIGFAAVILTAHTSMHMLAQPRVWPPFLLAQLGLFLMLFTRFWQRGAETSLALQNPIAGTVDSSDLQHPIHRINLRPEFDQTPATPDPIPNPEPASPSLDGPDPGVFQHDPTRPPD